MIALVTLTNSKAIKGFIVKIKDFVVEIIIAIIIITIVIKGVIVITIRTIVTFKNYDYYCCCC